MDGEEVSIALAWLTAKYYTEDGSLSQLAYITDYDLYLYSPSGTLMLSSTSSKNNVELIRFGAQETGTYRVIVKQYGYNMTPNDWMSLTIYADLV